MSIDTKEKGFEQAIESHLITQGGWVKGDPKDFDAALALTPPVLIQFLKDTQPKQWKKLQGIYGSQVEQKVPEYIAKSLDQRGMLDVLRKGVTDRGVKLRLAFFQPASGMNPETLALYKKNILTVTRQVHFSPTKTGLSVDVLLSLNGLPIATAELKNPFTGQTVEHAKRQYCKDRSPKEPLFQFKKRALVHFAVDPDLVYMTTKLQGSKTYFLPFNKGRDGGKGNPDNQTTGWRSAYLWEDIWQRDSWMDILARFIHLEVKEEIKDGTKVRKETIIFPRYHQLDAVRKLIAAVRTDGPGTNYLIQHSAGSGKSNSIAWLVHRLSNLHNDADQVVFDSVVVVTDRIVLDKQLQDTIYQFDHKQGVVEKVDVNSNQLAEALTAGTRIIITTLQKFSFVMDKIQSLPNRNYAIIADEAHSSQSGESATNLRRVLASPSLEQAEAEESEVDVPANEIEEEILKTIDARGQQPNLSFFAFTATPKHKTLVMFGHQGKDGKPEAFHLYSMRQAIEEGFILDVLKNYTTYTTYYELTKAIEDDPELDRKKAMAAVARFVSLHPHELSQKTEVMVEHFRNFSRHKIGGKAKAMVVTRSRLHAVRYKQSFDKYIKEKGYDRGSHSIKALVAFSGTVKDENGLEFTEAKMNGFGQKELPRKFDTDEFQLLLVAEKYQTGFDQPLLHTMYVDKRLKGLQAVQTLSRLNRTCPGKEDTFILDFCNDPYEIQEAFKPYFEATEIEQQVDPNSLYTLKAKLDASQIYWHQEVEGFAKVFFKPADKLREEDKGLLHKYVNPAAERFKDQPEDNQEDFRHELASYLRLYAFLAHVVTFKDIDLEKLYAYGRLLITKLEKRDDGSKVFIDDEVMLTYYRLQKEYEGSQSLSAGDTEPVIGPTDVGTGRPTDEDLLALSEVVKVLNERFGTDFTDEDQLLFDQVVGDLKTDQKLVQQAQNNTLGQFKYAFDPKAIDALLGRIEKNEKISSQIIANEDMRAVVLDWMMHRVFQELQQP